MVIFELLRYAGFVLMSEYPSIIKDLEILRNRPGFSSVFGFHGHHGEVSPSLSAAEVAAFESKWSFVIPTEYRQFLLEVGNGGAGPNYGIYPLGLCDHRRDQEPWDEQVGDPASPFPHNQAWNDLSGRPDDDDQPDSSTDEQWSQFRLRYFDRSLVNGAIPISNRGCALEVLLVVNGPECGNIWHDDRADQTGIYPVRDEHGNRVTFFTWYRKWLDDALAVY